MLPSGTSIRPPSGEVRLLSWVSTSAIRFAASWAMVVMTNTMESIMTEARICTP